jgi:hypothetical protein
MDGKKVAKKGQNTLEKRGQRGINKWKNKSVLKENKCR